MIVTLLVLILIALFPGGRGFLKAVIGLALLWLLIIAAEGMR